MTSPTIRDLSIAGAWLYTPTVHGDDRGSFHESFRAEQFTEHLGYPFDVAQANLSRSAKNVVRGLHLAEVPPGQAKFVSCVAGSVRDVLVDVRRGSPTFGQHITVNLSEDNNHAVFVPIGVAHGFVATSDYATVSYLVTEAYNPAREFGIDPFDAGLAVDWGLDRSDAILSENDASAPAFDDLAVVDRLPTWNDCRGWEKELREDWAAALAEAEEFGQNV